MTTATRPARAARERRHYAHSPLLGGVEMLAAEYRQHTFPRHAQDVVVIGLVEAGTIDFSGGGEQTTMHEGDVLFIAPGTVHEAIGHADSPWTYRALYLTPQQWEAACLRAGAPMPDGAAVLRAPHLYERLRGVHRHLVGGTLPERLLEDTVRVVVDSVVQYAGHRGSTDPRAVDAPLARVRRVLDEQLTRRVPLGEMAALAGLSRFHFLRAFSRAYGVSPYAYSLNRRLLEAQRRLSHGAAISMTALEFGFADQAHLTRHFLRTIGVTPGEYQRAFSA
jgi:AraC-like DNA-binding protein